MKVVIKTWCLWICSSWYNSCRNSQQHATVYKSLLLFFFYWRYNPLWVLAFLVILFHSAVSSHCLLHRLTPIIRCFLIIHPHHVTEPGYSSTIKLCYSMFIWSSTCFGRHAAHHQELKTALAASGFAYVKGCWTLSLLDSVQQPQLPTSFHVCKTRGC